MKFNSNQITPFKVGSIALMSMGLFSIPMSAMAQQSDGEALEEITVIGKTSTYSAIKTDTPILETARSISIETDRDLRNIGALELADAYTYSAGVTGEAFGFATRGDWLRVRGLDVPQYQDSLQSLFGNYNNTRPEVYTLSQVEILKGPASVLYGQGSPGGIVNVVSKTPTNFKGNEIVASFGNFDYRQIAADFGGQLDADGKWLFRLVGLRRDSDTQINFVSNDATVVAPSVTYRPSDDTNITFLYNYQKSESASGAQFIPLVGTLTAAPNGQFIDNNAFVGEPNFNRYDGSIKSFTILADHQFNDTWSIQVTARHTEGNRDYEQAWVALGFNPGRLDRFVFNTDGSLFGGGRVPRSFYQSASDSEQDAVDVRFRANFATGAVDHQLMIGGQRQDVTTSDDTAYLYAIGYDFITAGPDAIIGDTFWVNVFDPVYGNVPPQSVFDANTVAGPDVTVKDLGFYVNDQMAIGQWRWNIGVRFDDTRNESAGNRQDDDATSVATGLLYRFENSLSPYVSYAESFEPVVGLDVVTEEAFKPQQGEQVEVGFKYELPESLGFVTLAYFDIEQSNLLTSTPVGQTQVGGVDSVKGWELESKFRLGDFRLEANVSDLETETEAGFRFASVPDTQASAWLGYAQPGERGFRAGLGVRYAGDSYGGQDLIKTPSYTLVDAMVGYDFAQWSLQVNARNLNDKDYQSTCLIRGDCFPGERRTVVGTVRYNF